MAEVKTEPSDKTTMQKSQSRPNTLCCYSQRVCNLEKLKGFDFCHKHILEDKASPFKPCDFYAKINDKRCMNPAPKMSDNQKSYCLIHTRKAELRRAVEKNKKKRQREHSNNVEVEGSGFEKRRRTSSSASQKSHDGTQHDDESQTSDEELSTDLAAGGSLKVDSAWHGDIDSDAESVDSEEEDYLRHAGTWTVDEAAKMCVDKMTRLKSLYMAQYKRLFHVLKEKRRKYLQLIQAEQESEGEACVSPSEALGTSTHSKKHGVEALLHKQSKEKRHGITPRHQSSSHQRCTHVSGVRCANKILPLTKFCIHHISHDPNQLLFQSCTFKTGDDKTCSNVVPNVYSYSTCQLHMRLTAEPTRSNLENDLQEASKRDLERKEGEESLKNVKGILKPFPSVSEITKQGAQLPIPVALQQKSSALIPPLASDPMDTADAPETSRSIRDSPLSKPKHAIPHLKLEKMDVESVAPEPTPLVGSAESTPMELMSPASGASTPAGVKSISPTLLAASLVAVCSATPSPSVTSAQATSSSDLTVMKESYGMTSSESVEKHPSRTVMPTSLAATSLAKTSDPSGSQCTVTSTSTSVVQSESNTTTSMSVSIAETISKSSGIQSQSKIATSTTPSLVSSESTCTIAPLSSAKCLSAPSDCQSQSNAVTSTLTSAILSEPNTATSKTTTAIIISSELTKAKSTSKAVNPSQPHTATTSHTPVVTSTSTSMISSLSTVILCETSKITSNDSSRAQVISSAPNETSKVDQSTAKDKQNTQMLSPPNSSLVNSISSQPSETANSSVETSTRQSTLSNVAPNNGSTSETPPSTSRNIDKTSESCDEVDNTKDS